MTDPLPDTTQDTAIANAKGVISLITLLQLIMHLIKKLDMCEKNLKRFILRVDETFTWKDENGTEGYITKV